VVEAARARGSLQGLFRPNDYPTSAAESGDQGSTGVRLAIGPDGRVTACSVTRSSGSRALDAATCSVLRSRARYTPARDQNSQPTGDTQGATITWRLSE
jgi:protein TonB